MMPQLNVTITKTADGRQDYIQIMSSDLFAVNVVLIADKIIVQDHRPSPKSGVPRLNKK